MFTGWGDLSAAQKKALIRLAAALIFFYLLIIGFGAADMYKSKLTSNAIHEARLSPTAAEPGQAPPDALISEGKFTTVKVGTYVDSIDNLSIKDSFWSTTFYIWFSWNGDKSADPGGKLQIINGVITKKELQDEYHGSDGQNYQQYMVTAKITKFFDISRIPIEDHVLNIYVEDADRDGTKLRYIADEASQISSRVTIPGYTIKDVGQVVKTHTYNTTFGDPRRADKSIYSQYISSIHISRVSFGFYFKIFLSLFAALLLTFASFFIKASEGPRFALPTGAYFGAVANTYIANSLLPASGGFGLIDIITGIGLFTIFLAITLSLYAYYLISRKNEPTYSRLFDRIALLVLGVCCLAANIVIPLVARG
jgi:hypothetical protein